MWLINIATKQLEQFEVSIPPYAILSHRWGAEELTFQEVIEQKVDLRKRGYQKFVRACHAAGDHNVDYIWMDTCCIDKKSSAELSEAINSMFNWYKDSKVCLAYLEDVESEEVDESFANSVWWTRSWTLQELIAPKNVVFYNKHWQVIVDKSSATKQIEDFTSIPEPVLLNSDCLWEYNLLTKMSWASERKATRVEDIAYSLMGVFGIYMPLLYGEGKQAFIRLQEAIIRTANTTHFLAWGVDKVTSDLLASSPAGFQYPQNIVPPKIVPASRAFNTPFALTNLGLEIEVPLFRCALNIYGIDLGICMVYDGDNVQLHPEMFVLLLRRHSRARNAFYKISLVTMPKREFYFEERKFTIMRGTKEQRIAEAAVDGSGNYSSVGEPYSLVIRFADRIRIDPFILRPPLEYEGSHFHGEQARWDIAEPAHVQKLTAVWFQPLRWPYGFFTCQLPQSHQLPQSCHLFFEISFDIDSRPCLLIKRYIGETRRSYYDIGRRTLYQVCSEYQPVDHGPQYAGCAIKLRADQTSIIADDLSLFIRAPSTGNSIWHLPLELDSDLNLESDGDVWVELVDMQNDHSNGVSWILNILDAPWND